MALQTNEEELTAQQLIEQFRIEPTISMSPSINQPNDNQSQAMLPTSNADAVQFSQRPMYANTYNPMHTRRTKAIQAIYQFLEEENLIQSLHELQQETRIGYKKENVSEFGVLLEALDLREAYHSAQSKSSCNTPKYIETLKANEKTDEEPCINLLYKFHGVHKSNILCVDAFYHKNITYIISGVATRSLQILSCKDIFNLSAQSADKYEEHDSKECISRIVSEMNDLCGPPLYIDVDPKYKRYAMVTCMDGSIYVIDLYSTITTADTDHNWIYVVLKDHNKYVTIGRWNESSQYLLTAAHDCKATLYEFVMKEDDTFEVNKLHQYAFTACVESIAWLSNKEFVISVRHHHWLEYYKIEQNMDSCSYLEPYLKCNINAFGDSHMSFCVGDIHASKDGKFILAKTDHEKVFLMINGTENILKTYYGSHSDLYTYTRCCFSAKGKYIYASHHNDFIIWNALTAKLIYRQRNAHQKTVRDLCFDEKHGVVITASFDKCIKIWCS